MKSSFHKNACSEDTVARRGFQVNPKGIVLEMTVVLMFHQRLLTRNDKAFHIECLYLELSQRFTHQLQVSMLPSTEVRDDPTIREEAALPKCAYEVLDERGRRLSFAAIGQPVLHRWACEAAAESAAESAEEEPRRLYCLTVHSCEVDDGHGNVQKLLDWNG